MQKTLLIKALIVFGLMLLIGLPLLMIQETIKERMQFRQEAVDSIAADSVREQTLSAQKLRDALAEREEAVGGHDEGQGV